MANVLGMLTWLCSLPALPDLLYDTVYTYSISNPP